MSCPLPEAIIHTDAIQDNYKLITRYLSKGTKCTAVVKNDAYGLGARVISQKLYEAGCRDFWVAYLKEAVDIRRNLPFDANIYFLQGFEYQDIEQLKNQKIIPTINSISEFKTIMNQKIPFAIHIDTGLSRLGIRENDLPYIIDNIKNENIQYIISHLSCSENPNHPLNELQRNKFDEILDSIRQIKPIKSSLAASGGVFCGSKYSYDMVRVGGFLYGIEISDKYKPQNVLCIKSRVLQIYFVGENCSVGYGSTFITTKKTKIAVISIGYADGIKRTLSNQGVCLFYGKDKKCYRAPIIGNISMDLLTCDITEIPSEIISMHCAVSVLDESYTINEMSKDAKTIPYEILTSFNFKSQRFNLRYV